MDSIVQDAWKSELRMIRRTGFVPMKNKPFHYTLLAILFSIFTWVPVFSMLTKLFINLQDIDIATQILWLGTTQLSYVFKVLFFILNNGNIEIMQTYIDDPLFNDFSPEQEKKLIEAIKEGQFVSKCFRITIIVNVTLFFLKIFDPAKDLLQPGWFPFDEEKYYYWIFAFQYTSILVLAFVSSSIDILTYTVWSIGIVQFKLIADNLKNLGKIKYDGIGNSDEMEVNTEVRSKLQTCIIHHVKLMQYMKVTEQTFSVGIFFLFFFTVMVACLSGFIMVGLPKGSNEFWILVVYFGATMWQAFCYCWFGNAVMLSSSEVADGCFQSNWYEFDTSTARALSFMIARSQHPLKIRALRFIYISLPTFVAIMRSSYSYFALLQRLYGDS